MIPISTFAEPTIADCVEKNFDPSTAPLIMRRLLRSRLVRGIRIKSLDDVRRIGHAIEIALDKPLPGESSISQDLKPRVIDCLRKHFINRTDPDLSVMNGVRFSKGFQIQAERLVPVQIGYVPTTPCITILDTGLSPKLQGVSKDE